MGAPGKFCNPGIVCGLQREAACLSAVGIRDRVAVSGAHTARAVRVAQDLVSEGADALISFGLAGGLDPRAGTGAVILAERVVAWRRPMPKGVPRSFRQSLKDLSRGTTPVTVSEEVVEVPEDSPDIFTADSEMRALLLEVLGDKVLGGTLLGVEQVVRNPDQKLLLFAETEAMACDMESQAVAEEARIAGIPFVVLRIVSDPSHRTLPVAALKGLTDSGGVSTGAVMRAAVQRPWEIFDLLSLALDARVAFGALRRVAFRGAPLLGAVG